MSGAIDHLTRHFRLNRQVGGNVENLVADIARVRGAQFAIALHVIFLQKIGQSLIVVGNLFVRRDALENFARRP